MTKQIRKATSEDAAAIVAIYNYYVRNTAITFEIDEVSVEEMQSRIVDISAKYPYYVYEIDGKVVAYCYANLWKKRAAYKFCVESTIYVHHDFLRHGIGRKLMQTLIAELKERKLHIVVACITIPNPESVALHENLGFKKVAHYSEVGRKFNCWVDVGNWELII